LEGGTARTPATQQDTLVGGGVGVRAAIAAICMSAGDFTRGEIV
jgi:hypothetical protein